MSLFPLIHVQNTHRHAHTRARTYALKQELDLIWKLNINSTLCKYLWSLAIDYVKKRALVLITAHYKMKNDYVFNTLYFQPQLKVHCVLLILVLPMDSNFIERKWCLLSMGFSWCLLFLPRLHKKQPSKTCQRKEFVDILLDRTVI